MSTGRSLVYAIVIAVVSLLFLTIAHGVLPTIQQAVANGLEFALIAFIVFKFFVPKDQGRKPEE